MAVNVKLFFVIPKNVTPDRTPMPSSNGTKKIGLMQIKKKQEHRHINNFTETN